MRDQAYIFKFIFTTFTNVGLLVTMIIQNILNVLPKKTEPSLSHILGKS